MYKLGLEKRGMRDQIANIRGIIEKAREFQKNIYFCLMIHTVKGLNIVNETEMLF